MDMTYSVVRPFQGLAIGSILRTKDFLDTRRMQQLVTQRYITPVLTVDAPKMQPTAKQLTETPILELMQALETSDVSVIEEALKLETRTTAMTYMQRRINNGNSNH